MASDRDRESISDNSNMVVFGQENSPLEAMSKSPEAREQLLAQTIYEPFAGAQTIAVDVGSPRELANGRANPLRQQEVKHAFYKRERPKFKPLAKYAYDPYGTMVNQNRVMKKPTVGKFIQKAT